MPNITTNYGLTKPLPEEFYDIGVHNANMDIIDEQLQKAAAGGKRTVRLTIGASSAGWTADQCDYLCDGTADDAEINAAIAALPSTGGEIVILDGTYNITDVIDINKNYVVLRGNGYKTNLRRGFDGGRLIYNSGDHVVIENLSVDGVSYTYTADSNDGIYSYTPNTIIRGCIIQNESAYGIHVSGAKAKVIGNTVTDCTGSGIYIDDDNCTVTGNIVLSCGEAGIKVCDKNNVVTGNVARLNAIANMYLFYATNCIVTGNNFAVNDDDTVIPEEAAIYLSGTSNSGNLVLDNHMGVGGFYIYGGTGNVVANTPAITYDTTDITAGSASTEPEGSLHFVIE